MISYDLYKYSKTSVVGHFAHKNVPIPEIGEFVDLRPIDDQYKNHIGVFNMDDQMIGSVVSNLKAGDIKRGCENNHSLIEDVKTCNRMHFEVTEVVPYCSDVIIVIEGAFFAEPEQKPEEPQAPKKVSYLESRWNRSEASKQFGIVVKNQGYIGNNVITVTLGGYGKNPFKKDASGNNLPQWSWKDESDGLHKWGPSSKALNTKIAEAKASSGDKVSISFKDGWIVRKI